MRATTGNFFADSQLEDAMASRANEEFHYPDGFAGATWGILLWFAEGAALLLSGKTRRSSESPANYGEFELSKGTPKEL
jgi:hypothetical protein